MTSSVLRTVAILAALCLVVPAAHAADDPSVAPFLDLKKEVEALRKDPERRQYRHHYEKLIVKLQSIANGDDGKGKLSRADDAAFVAAQLLEELYYVSRVDEDRKAAVQAFVSCADRFPTSNLADDSLVAGARLTGDAALGRALLLRVVDMKTADMKAEAKSLLATPRYAAAPAPANPALSQALARVALDAPEAAPGKPEAAKAEAAKSEAAQPEAPSTAKLPAPAPAAQPAVSKPTLAPVEVLPDRPPPGTPTRKVIVIRHDDSAGESVVQVRLSGDVGITRGDVPAVPGQGRRIFFDLAPAKLGQRNIQPIEVGDGTVARVRAGQYDTEVVRLVVELEGDAEPALTVRRKPFEVRLSVPQKPPAVDVVAGVLSTPRSRPLVDLPSADEVKKRINSGAPGGVSISQQLGLKVHRIVIDAGHGGHDTGAVGPSGIKEKDITLQIAKRVRERLLKELPNIEVIMTREDDATLALQDRTNTANAAAADLFISIHCNASPFKRVRGVETYYLNITHDRYSMRLAARENAEAGEGSISDLDYILADLAMKSNVDDSVRLGRAVQKNVVKKLGQRWSDTKDLGLKHALFYVLMGNHMPSILVETSFLSNKTEEQRLASAAYQESIADGVVAGVRGFIEERQAFFAP